MNGIGDVLFYGGLFSAGHGRVWENALFGKLDVGVCKGKVTMAAAPFQPGWQKKEKKRKEKKSVVFIEREWLGGRKR